MNMRGAEVMGFDQENTSHHFLLYPDGGAIDVAVNDKAEGREEMMALRVPSASICRTSRSCLAVTISQPQCSCTRRTCLARKNSQS